MRVKIFLRTVGAGRFAATVREVRQPTADEPNPWCSVFETRDCGTEEDALEQAQAYCRLYRCEVAETVTLTRQPKGV